MRDKNGAIVAGLADPATKLCGLAWRLGDARGGLLFAGGEAERAEAELNDSEEAVELKLTAANSSCEATLTPRPGALTVVTDEGSAAADGSLDVAPCAAHVKLVAGETRRLDCAGHITRWERWPGADVETVRHLAMASGDGTVLVFAATRPRGATGHGDEETQAWLVDAEGTITPFGEALLSTEYDGAGVQRRFNLELWPTDPESPLLREAGTALGEVENGVAATVFEFAGDAGSGLGGYLIQTP